MDATKEWTSGELAALIAKAKAAGVPGIVLLPVVKTGEASLVAQFFLLLESDVGRALIQSDGVPDFCHVEVEYNFPNGRADIVIFHEDGSATIIEAKEGANGMRSVVSGLGQLASYAYQLGASKCAPKKIRRALMWSSVGSQEGDAHIEDVCRANGVIPIMMASTKKANAVSCEWLEKFLCQA